VVRPFTTGEAASGWPIAIERERGLPCAGERSGMPRFFYCSSQVKLYCHLMNWVYNKAEAIEYALFLMGPNVEDICAEDLERV